MKKLVISCSFIFLMACENSHQETTPICKTSTNSSITYQNDVQPILVKNCLSCHSNKEHSGGVKLEDLNDAKFWAGSGGLYDQIIPFGGNPPRMPKAYALTDCEVSIIKNWIDNGLK